MDGKYDREISLRCPTCGNSLIEYEHGVDETIEMVTCASCRREMTKDQLIQENSENISVNKQEILNEARSDAINEIRKSFRKIFRGSKYVKFR